jgi:hypothetical protein
LGYPHAKDQMYGYSQKRGRIAGFKIAALTALALITLSPKSIGLACVVARLAAGDW